MKKYYYRSFLIIFLSIVINASYAQKLVSNTLHIEGLKDDRTFFEYFEKFKLLVKNNDKYGLEKLASKSYSPYSINGSLDINKKIFRFEINNRKDFLKYYPKLFDKRMRDIIAKQDIKDLKIKDDRICLYRGQIWWNYDNKRNVIWISSIANYNLISPRLTE